MNDDEAADGGAPSVGAGASNASRAAAPMLGLELTRTICLRSHIKTSLDVGSGGLHRQVRIILIDIVGSIADVNRASSQQPTRCSRVFGACNEASTAYRYDRSHAKISGKCSSMTITSKAPASPRSKSCEANANVILDGPARTEGSPVQEREPILLFRG